MGIGKLLAMGLIGWKRKPVFPWHDSFGTREEAVSIYAALDGKLSGQVASNTGWGDFIRWVEGLPPEIFLNLRHLVTFGWEEELDKVGNQLEGAIAGYPPHDDVKQVAETLLAEVRNANASSVLTITDGMGPDDGSTGSSDSSDSE